MSDGGMTEGPSVRVDNRPISYAQLFAFTVVIVANAFGAGVAYWNFKANLDAISVRVDQIEAYRVSRSTQTDKNFGELRTKLEPLDTLADKVARTEAGVTSANARIDRIVESFGGKFDNLIETMNQIKVDVGVLTGEVRSLSSKRAALEPPDFDTLGPLDQSAFR